MKPFVSKHLWWILALVATLALMPRGVVTEAELNRKGANGEDRHKWTEYLVFEAAAMRMAKGENIDRIDLKKATSAEELETWAEYYRQELHVDLPAAVARRINVQSYSYPPLWAMLTIPFHMIGNHLIETILWHLLVMAGLIFGARIAYRLVYPTEDPPTAQVEVGKWAKLLSPRGVGVIACVVSAGYFLGSVSYQQNDSMVFALAMIGAWQLSKGRSLWAGLFLAAAALSKGPLLLVLPWLAYKRRWAALSWTLVFCGVWAILPSLLFPRETGVLHISEWIDITLKPILQAGDGLAPTTAWARFNELNQSLGAAIERNFAMRNGADTHPALFEISDGSRKILTYGLYLALLGVAFYVGKTRAWSASKIISPRAQSFVEESCEDQPRQLALEFSVLLILGLLLSPMTSPPHLCMTFPALVVLLRALSEAPKSSLRWVILAFAAAMLLVHKDLLGRPLVNGLRFYGLSALVMLLMLTGLCMVARNTRLQFKADA